MTILCPIPAAPDIDGPYLDFGDTSVFSSVAGATLAAWVQMSNPIGELDRCQLSVGNRLQLWWSHTDIFIRARRIDADGETVVLGIGNARQWMHVAGVADYSNGLLTIYVNGQDEGSDVLDSSGVSEAGDQLMDINKLAHLDFAGAGPACVADIRCYPRAFTATEVLSLYNARGRDGHAPYHRIKCFETPQSTLVAAGPTVVDTSGRNPGSPVLLDGESPSYRYDNFAPNPLDPSPEVIPPGISIRRGRGAA